MFSGFNLSFDTVDKDFYQRGLTTYNSYKNQIEHSLNNYLSPDGSINGSQMQADWFPLVKANIFISHSHDDQDAAITLAGMLSALGLTVFIDSCIWGYAPDLLKKIDNKYCLNEDRATYNYDERNKSTSHVHIMLSTALSMMIDKVECVMFLNTPNSIKSSDIKSETFSPWIYAEIAMTKYVRRRQLNEYRPTLLKGMEQTRNLNENLSIKYQLNLDHLMELTDDDLINWVNKYSQSIPKPVFALDLLYEIFSNKTIRL
ncbi:hypothetical protein [Mucilaginibacter sp. L196]|uniref:hypothetical protein n=1 Tax=Mucilaginibacter sp. L196 TaxID=1641870 RepID=UPI00131B4C1C|nr:hypothetical protein [Mucilaginibacter sp. L196]